jgi:hypothetical protein
MTIPSDVIERLPDLSRAKLLLIDGLAADALDASRSAQNRLNEIGRRRGGPSADDPNVTRLGSMATTQNHRAETLASLAAACVRWIRALPEGVALEPVSPKPPELSKGESPEAKVMAIRAKVAELSVERASVMQAPPLKADMRRQVRPFVEGLAKRGQPRLRLERGKPFEAMFVDDAKDFGIHEGFIAQTLAWLAGGTMIERLEGMVDAMPERGALSDPEQTQRLAALGSEIEALERDEEALIEAAFADGLDILRRRNASPGAVLGVRVAAAAAVQRAAAE